MITDFGFWFPAVFSETKATLPAHAVRPLVKKNHDVHIQVLRIAIE